MNRRVRVMGIASGKGGVGKSNLTANLAVQAARAGVRTLVLDADLGLANVDVLYGLEPRLHLGHLIEGSASVEQVVVDGPAGVRLLPGGSGLQSLSQLDAIQKMRLVNALDALDGAFDLVLVDAGAGIGDNVLFFIGAAQETMLVVTPEPTALADGYAAVKALASSGVDTFHVVVNMAPSDEAARDVFDKLSSVASRFLNVRMRYAGFVPRDENLHRAVMAQRPLVLSFPQSPASRAITRIANGLLDAAPPDHVGGGLKFMWMRLLRESRQASVG